MKVVIEKPTLEAVYKKLREPHMGSGPLFTSEEVEAVFDAFGDARNHIARLLGHHDRYDRGRCRAERAHDDDDALDTSRAVSDARDYYFEVPASQPTASKEEAEK